MKIACIVSVGDRTFPNLPKMPLRKYQKSTLALCKHPNSNEFCILFFSQQNKKGSKYLVKTNISQILTRFINDGKATIQFKQPPHDFYIQSDDVVQLKRFLTLLKRILDNKITTKTTEESLPISSLAVQPIPIKDLPMKKLAIKHRCEYPNSFPQTLETLFVNTMKISSLDLDILQLKKLKVLDLSDNCIEYLPEEFNQLANLTTLTLASNRFDKSTLKQWNWLGGNLTKTLTYLNLESNNLQYLPNQIIKLQKLINLNISKNQLKSLPIGIGTLKQLKYLNCSDNQLVKLPSTARLFHLQTLELSNNQFENFQSQQPFMKLLQIKLCTLRELSARIILNKSINYDCTQIPAILVNYLDNYAKYCCLCGQACFDVFYQIEDRIELNQISQNVYTNWNSDVVIDAHYCSLRCIRLKARRDKDSWLFDRMRLI